MSNYPRDTIPEDDDDNGLEIIINSEEDDDWLKHLPEGEQEHKVQTLVGRLLGKTDDIQANRKPA